MQVSPRMLHVQQSFYSRFIILTTTNAEAKIVKHLVHLLSISLYIIPHTSNVLQKEKLQLNITNSTYHFTIRYVSFFGRILST